MSCPLHCLSSLKCAILKYTFHTWKDDFLPVQKEVKLFAKILLMLMLMPLATMFTRSINHFPTSMLLESSNYQVITSICSMMQ